MNGMSSLTSKDFFVLNLLACNNIIDLFAERLPIKVKFDIIQKMVGIT